METSIAGLTFDYPATAEELRLGDWVEFMNQSGRALDQGAAAIEAMPPGADQLLAAMANYANRAYAVAAFFAGEDLATLQQRATVGEVTSLYRDRLLPILTAPAPEILEWNGTRYQLPPPVLHQGSIMTFGEVLDGKAMEQNQRQLDWSRWQLIQYLAAIFLRPPGEVYQDECGYLDGARYHQMADLPMSGALMISSWYDQLNEFMEAGFTVFQDSAFKPGPYMKKHFSMWGWVNFLKEIAATKVFDKAGSGLNSIECARRSRAFDVLMYASESKEYNEAMTADYERKKPV